MSAAFYKSSDGALMAAWAIYETDVGAVRAAGKEFAAHFGGKLLMRSDFHGNRVAGLCFQPAKDDPLWTKPDAQLADKQRPRSSLRKGTKEQRQALAALLTEWSERFPKLKADLAPVLAAMGTDWGALFFCGIGFFKHDGAIYVCTSAKLAPCMVEILSSEYNAAKAAYESIKEAA
ncbi:hypothetical protein GJ698_02465 [Pseudoduganella sp. FT26W]|uniref:Uncharacterized protein n=1 Tax=Duganella aquatilis TaxID=2666082 RepID=A0A844CRP2_9BURK|nr:hypothetical protein [Duganella aquatilis]MRW82953.1 hypothetical protein [Duganella aquatilis]